MKTNTKTLVVMMRVAFWLGIVLDALAFVQMAFPPVGAAMLGALMQPTPEYIFGVNLGAGLMLAWTLLLAWADRKPMERRAVLALTMIVPAWNLPTLVYGIRAGLLVADRIMPQMIVLTAVFFYYGLCFILAQHAARKLSAGVN
jgi:hypothetical protein